MASTNPLSFNRLLSASTIMMQSLGKNTNIRLSQILEHRDEDEIFLSRRTRIICTMGPCCWDVEKLVQMIDAGMNVCRLNFSHGDHAVHKETVENIRLALKQRPDKRVAIMLDTKGPEIRTGCNKNGEPITVVAGSSIKITTDYNHIGDAECIACNYPSLHLSVAVGGTLLVADGSLALKVKAIGNGYIICTVLNTATFGEHKNMNLPKVKVKLPVIGEKDIHDIVDFGIPMGISFVAVSFVQCAEDVRCVRNTLGREGRHIRIFPKIENVEGLQNFDDILTEADGIMVARGDLGMELPPEKVFLAQKMMITKCNVAGKPVITATQMLESMTKNPRPTRAEAADVANAVLDGTDCVMLSGETANGSFPIEAVKVMARICVEAEACIDYPKLYLAICAAVPRPVSTQEAVACAAVETAAGTDAALIIVLTESGHTANLIAKYRPSQLVLALSASTNTILNMQVLRGVLALQVPTLHGTDMVIHNTLALAKERGLVQIGESIVAVHGIREEVSGGSNLMKVLEVE